ncbi:MULTISPECIES: ABC transporter ATP-binding protein/permease [Deinococcus]|uniref:ABC transporter ATP-binding protein/permease n=1 Tax=Deinococcus rufus TaxID=2136097 RepID=A0ABV7Z7C8_9DEIO|nr:ATP-binding cassette domain-containing protein [Deinococcus sp. AB2017081]WQE97221.1 ATP-binding cassette domain-containing protein [Deinococcus sp. AB2017081]
MPRSPSSLRWLAHDRRVWHGLGLSAVLSLLGLGLGAGAFILIAQAIARALAGAPLQPGELWWVGGLLLGRALAQGAREWAGQGLAARMIRHWRGALTRQALALGPVALSRTHGAELLTLDAELGPRLAPLYARYLPSAVHAGLAFAVVLAVTARLDGATAGVLLLTGPLTLLLLALVGLATHAATERQWVAHTRLAGRLLTLTRHLPTLHAFGVTPAYREVLARTASAQRAATMGVLKVAFLSGFVMDFAATLATALAAVWIGVRLFGGEAQLAPTLAALMLVPEFFGPLRQLGADRHAALDAEPVGARLRTLLSTVPGPSGPHRPRGPGHLELRAAHAELSPHTAPLSADLPPGSRLALRGPSGSGKTTLLCALAKYTPYAGQILVDGQALDEFDAAAWRERVAYVPQHPRLIAASVRDNLRLGRPGASDAELMAVAASVGLLPVLGALPGGWDAPLGEGGVSLSGGETARLALARALLSGAGVLLLDEVTAHLDAESERSVLLAMDAACTGRTVVLATHRPAPAGWEQATLAARGAS